MVSNNIASIVDNQPPFSAGSLKHCVHAWAEITSDPFILDAVTHCHIEFDVLPGSEINKTKPYFTFNKSEHLIIDAEIQKFLQKGIIKLSASEPGEVISPIFITPKKDGSSRVIFNLKGLNEFVSYHHFKMDTLDTAIKLMRPGCFMTSIDLKDAYYSIPVAPECQKYLKFVWKETLYCFTCLPMGLTSSPRIFTKVLKPVFASLRTKFGHTCLGYIDDSLYMEDTQEDCLWGTLHAVPLISKLGFQIHPEKSVLLPTQCIEFLGFLLDSTSMTVRLTSPKRDKLVQMCQKFLQPNKLYTIRQVASLIGSLVSSFPGVEFGPLHYRALEADKDSHLRMHQGHFDALMSLSAGSLEDLNWWVFHLPSASKNIYHSPPNLILHTDASGIGWGTTLSNGSTTHGIWSQAEASRHINYLELQAVYLALSSLLNHETNVHVRVMCDNVTAVTYINEMGGCKSEQCNSVAKLIWNWAIARRIWVSAAHVAGSANINADHLSRNVNLNLEWMLSTATFQAIVNMFGQPDIDLFASRLNAQLETYVSWKPDPKAKYIDAFSIVWSGFFHAFPPFCLASRCVQKIIQDKATGILVIPLWPTQPFFSVVLSLLMEVPRMLKVTRHNLVHPTLAGPHPLQDQLKLLVCKLSGDPWRTQTFHQTLLTSSCIPGDTVLTNSMITTSQNGCSFVVKGRVIPCVPL